MSFDDWTAPPYRERADQTGDERDVRRYHDWSDIEATVPRLRVVPNDPPAEPIEAPGAVPEPVARSSPHPIPPTTPGGPPPTNPDGSRREGTWSAGVWHDKGEPAPPDPVTGFRLYARLLREMFLTDEETR